MFNLKLIAKLIAGLLLVGGAAFVYAAPDNTPDPGNNVAVEAPEGSEAPEAAEVPDTDEVADAPEAPEVEATEAPEVAENEGGH